MSDEEFMRALREAALKAAAEAGGSGGLANFLYKRAVQHPVEFMRLLGDIAKAPKS